MILKQRKTFIKFGDASSCTVIAGGDCVGVIGEVPERLAPAVFDSVASVNSQIKDGRTFLAFRSEHKPAGAFGS